MKKILTLIIFTVMIASVTGCSDYLDVKPRGYDVPHKLSHYEGLLFGAESSVLFNYHFGTFEHTIDAMGYMMLFSMEGQAAANAYTWRDTIYLADDNCEEWNTPCSKFYTFNVVVDEVMDAEDGTDTQRRAIQAEARFMRAWYTYMMAQYFGKPYNATTAATDPCIPIIKEASTVGSDFSRHTVAEVYDYILTEMSEALPSLTKRSAHSRRIFHTAGNAMLGKVYWMMGDYANALPYLKTAKESIESDSGIGLIDFNDIIDEEWGELDYPNLDYSPETIFNVAGMPNLWTCLGPLYMGSPFRTLRIDIMQDYFEVDDYRLAFFSGFDSGENAYVNFDPEDRYYTNMTNMTSNEGITVPDVYLMYAESLARTGESTTARSILTQVRSMRMAEAELPSSVSSQDELIQFIVAERIRENFGLGLNWYDMRRLWNDPLFQDMKQYYTRTDGTNTYTLTEARLTMRIPPSVMTWHPEYVQNE